MTAVWFLPYEYLSLIATILVMLGGILIAIGQRRFATSLFILAALMIFAPVLDELFGVLFNTGIDVVSSLIASWPWWTKAGGFVIACLTVLWLILALFANRDIANHVIADQIGELIRFTTRGPLRVVFWPAAIAGGAYVAYGIHSGPDVGEGAIPRAISVVDQSRDSRLVGLLLSADTMGSIRIGMSYEAVQAAIGGQLERDLAYLPAASCYYASSTRLGEGIWLLFNAGSLARIDVRSEAITTELGVHVGSDRDEVDRAYGYTLEKSLHKYLLNGTYMRTTSAKNARAALVFETDGARVIRIRAGRTPEVDWLEGCG